MKMTIQEQFEAFHKAHPEVYDAVVRYAKIAKLKKHKRYGIRSVWERVRWFFQFEDHTQLQLNDHFHSRYARLIMEQEPELADFFRTRTLRAK